MRLRVMREWISRLIDNLHPRRSDEDLREELRLHAELAAEQGRRQGLDEADAARAARLKLGAEAQTLEALRDQTGLPWLRDLTADVRHALRALRRAPAFSVFGALTLALGIAAAVTIFSVLQQIVLTPLPYPQPGRLVRLESPVPGVRPDAVWNLSTAEYFYFGRQAHSIDRIAIYFSTTVTLGPDSATSANAERVSTALVSPEMFELLGARPALGRLLDPSDYGPRIGDAVVLSYATWQTHFGGASDIVGRQISIEDRPVSIVGVMAPGVTLPDPLFMSTLTTDIWMPMALDPAAPAVNQHTFKAIARLRQGVEATTADRELASLTRRLPALFPSAYSDAFMKGSQFSTSVTPLRDDVLGATGRVVWVLAAAVSLLFIIAAANVSNLFLLRAEERRREFTTRLALGATRLRLARYVMIESLLVCTAAAGVAATLTVSAMRTFVQAAPEDIPRLAGLHVNATTIGLIVAATILSAIAFALITAFRVRDHHPDLLRQATMTTASPRERRGKGVLVMAQVAMSLVLACAAALMGQTVWRLLNVDPGFHPAGVITANIVLPRAQYTSESRIAAYQRELVARLEADPEIDRAAVATTIPFDGNDGCSAVFVEGRSRGVANGNVCVDVSRVSSGYFDTMKIPLREGSEHWADGIAGTVIVSESAARHIWPGENPIGKGLRVNGFAPPYYRVIGVAADVRRVGLDRPVAESVYFPIESLPGSPIFSPPRALRMVMRVKAADTAALIARVRSSMAAIDAGVPLANERPLEQMVRQSMARSSLASLVLSLAAALAILLSAVGLYGVVAYTVMSRKRELGVRLAIGALPRQIRRMVVRETVFLVLPGLAIGVVVSIASAKLLEGLLYGVTPRDLTTMAGATAILLATSAAAASIPAWRASAVDPVEALRFD